MTKSSRVVTALCGAPCNIPCKLEKASYNIFFVRAVMVKSLYTLRLSSGYNDLLNSENLKVDIGKLCHDIEVCNFTLL